MCKVSGESTAGSASSLWLGEGSDCHLTKTSTTKEETLVSEASTSVDSAAGYSFADHFMVPGVTNHIDMLKTP